MNMDSILSTCAQLIMSFGFMQDVSSGGEPGLGQLILRGVPGQ